MREKLKALVELQKVDMEIAQLRKAAEIYPKQLADLDKELAAARSAMDAERARLTDIDKQKRTLEQNIVEEKDKVKKWESRLSDQRSTREYAALAREIDIAKKANETMSQEIVELGKTQAQAREAVKAKEQEFSARQDQIGGKISELKSKVAEVDTEVRKLEEKRAKAAGTVDSNLLRRYDHVKKKKLPGVVALQAPGTCLGCNMNVPPQLYNTLRSNLGTDVCPSCHRIIFAQEALEPGAAK